ncbi:hypothetical protein, partial [Dermatophilus congolensis]
PALARLHRDAFPNFFLTRLGQPFLREFYRAYATDPTAITITARMSNNQPIGIAVGTTDPTTFYARLLRRRAIPFALAATRAALTHPRTVIPRLLRALHYRGDTPPGSNGALLASICISPTLKKTGTGAKLTHTWTTCAHRHGATSAYLTTDADNNDAVNRHYSRQGWTIESTYTTPAGRRMHRYVKELP